MTLSLRSKNYQLGADHFDMSTGTVSDWLNIDHCVKASLGSEARWFLNILISPGSLPTRLRWGGSALYGFVTNFGVLGENILKIDQRLARLKQKQQGSSFVDSECTVYSNSHHEHMLQLYVVNLKHECRAECRRTEYSRVHTGSSGTAQSCVL